MMSQEKDQGDINRQLTIDPTLWETVGDVYSLKVLDAGCGNGYLTRELARREAKAVGVDHSQELIEYCLKTEEETSLGCEFYQGSLSDLSILKDQSFDLVVSNIVMVDVLDYKAAFKEINRVLRPKGRFVWSNVHPVFGRISNLFHRLPYDTKRNEERK